MMKAAFAQSRASKRRAESVSHRPGFTLIELVVALAAGALLMAGMASTLYLAGKSLDHGGSRAVQTKRAVDAVDEFAMNLEHAKSLSIDPAGEVTLTVPDRDGDELDETIRYSWSDAGGGRVWMSINDQTAGVVARDVQSLDLSLEERDVTGTGFARGFIDDPYLSAYWRFDEGYGATAHDTTLNANNGMILGAVWTGGYCDDALQFDGATSRVATPHHWVLSTTDDLTITAWVWLDPAHAAGRRTIVNKGTQSDRQNYYLLTEDGKLVFGYQCDGRHEFISPNVLPLGQWCHVAAALSTEEDYEDDEWDDCNLTLFVDGLPVLRAELDEPLQTNSDALSIGASQYGEHFSGTLDEIRIYRRRLSDGEIMKVRDGSL